MSHPSSRSLPEARMIMLVAYVVATVVGWLTLRYMPEGAAIWANPLWQGLAADCTATIAIFVFSFWFSNSSFYDAYWSVAPPLLGVYWITTAAPTADPLRQALAMLLCWAWGVRLTYNWGRGWTGLDHEDWRYVDLKAKSGKAYWLVSFFGLHFFPTFQVFAGCVGFYVALTAGGHPFGLIDVAAVVVTAGAIVIEALADEQLRAFAKSPDRAPGSVMMGGLWAYSRHPNYFGEMSFWWGLFLFGLAANPSEWRIMLVGPVAITLMFFGVSVPMMEKRQLERKPSFAEHIRTTSMIIPWFRKG
jgi:steroid 5-alpha reductase family enzyme